MFGRGTQPILLKADKKTTSNLRCWTLKCFFFKSSHLRGEVNETKRWLMLCNPELQINVIHFFVFFVLFFLFETKGQQNQRHKLPQREKKHAHTEGRRNPSSVIHRHVRKENRPLPGTTHRTNVIRFHLSGAKELFVGISGFGSVWPPLEDGRKEGRKEGRGACHEVKGRIR